MQLRKGEVFEGSPELVKQARDGEELTGGGVLSIFAMPHESEAGPDLEKVDLHFITIGVYRLKAESKRAELLELLAEYPDPESLAGGPSYITVGAEIGSQSGAFQLFALGKALGLWQVITPRKLGVTGDMADQMAGSGFIMMTGYSVPAIAAA